MGSKRGRYREPHPRTPLRQTINAAGLGASLGTSGQNEVLAARSIFVEPHGFDS